MSRLRFSGVSVGHGRREVLSDLSMPSVDPGCLVGLLGRNGVGKSTLLRALIGLGKYTGRVELDGTDLAVMGHRERALRIGYMPQHLPGATNLIAYEAVISALRAVNPTLEKRRAEALMEAVFTDLGIRDLALVPISRLSGGQRQMVGLAQVLVRDPQVMLLDEPTSALDLHRQLSALAVVRRRAQETGAVCIIALHDINLAATHCDRILLLGDGGVIADGDPRRALTPQTLETAYGVSGRVETCSRNRPMVLIDGIVETRSGRPQ